MRDWLDAIPNLGVPGVPGVQPQKSAVFRGTPSHLAGVPGVPEHLSGTPGTPSGTPAQSPKSLVHKEEHPEHREHRKNSDATLAEWRAALQSVAPDRPLHGLDRRRWQQLIEDAHWLLDHFGNQAARDGWSTFDLFGVMPGRSGWGGIADRLRSSRSLVMSADVAKWRRVINGERESFARGLDETVRMIPMWGAC